MVYRVLHCCRVYLFSPVDVLLGSMFLQHSTLVSLLRAKTQQYIHKLHTNNKYLGVLSLMLVFFPKYLVCTGNYDVMSHKVPEIVGPLLLLPWAGSVT